MSRDVLDLYQEVIIDHGRRPRNFRQLEDPTRTAEGVNPSCGDEITLYVKLDDGGDIADIAFQGSGCAISQASADLLIESIIGKPLEEVKQLNKQNILDLLGIDLGPVRLKCALLSLKVLKAGVYGLGEASDELVE